LNQGTTAKFKQQEELMANKNCVHLVLTFTTIFAVQGAMAGSTTHATNPAVANYARPLSFEPNRGQTNGQVDFLAHGAGYRLFLSHGEAVMALDRGVMVRMRPVGGKRLGTADPLEQQPSKSNYFIGNDSQKWHTGIANYAKVRYRNVYPGIDLIYYGNQRQLEYDFVVSAGVDPNRILLQFQGGTNATLDRSGDLLMHTAAGDLRWHKPIAYQQVNGGRKLIACSYARQGLNWLAFKLADYDRSRPLIIDPALVYSTYLGGSIGEGGSAIAVDGHGNAYITGNTISSDFPTQNAFQDHLPGTSFNFGAFVSKFDSAGKLVYSTYLSGSGPSCSPGNECAGGDQGFGIAVDAWENAYVTGSAQSREELLP
jgi:Beta-propeller repeat